MRMAAESSEMLKPWAVKSTFLLKKRQWNQDQMKQTRKICLNVHGRLVPNMWLNSSANLQMESEQYLQTIFKEYQKAPKPLEYANVIPQLCDDCVAWLRYIGVVGQMVSWLVCSQKPIRLSLCQGFSNGSTENFMFSDETYCIHTILCIYTKCYSFVS